MAGFQAPESILIIGGGAFGLSTAYALTQRPEWQSTRRITVLDRGGPGPGPSRDASSLDSSRIIRADYADPAYARLARAALAEWRRPGPDSIGGEGRYRESAFLIVADDDDDDGGGGGGGGGGGEDDGRRGRPRDGRVLTGMGYCRAAHANAARLAREADADADITVLPSGEAIAEASTTGAAFGDWGYLNRGSGWADAERAMAWLQAKVAATGRVRFESGTAERLMVHGRDRVTGAEVADGRVLSADLVLVAAGAWTPSLVDLRGRVAATGQVLAYMDITAEEQARLGAAPVLMNMSRGIFLIPPRDRVLKLGRHAYGYENPQPARSCLVVPTGAAPPHQAVTVSRPLTDLDAPGLGIPAEGEVALRAGLRALVPWRSLRDRPWSRTRLCWYSDTPTADFLIDRHPHWRGLAVATGGSGHAFKFLPVLGHRVADCLQGRCPADFRDKWAWDKDKTAAAVPPDSGSAAAATANAAFVTQDGSRSGVPGLSLADELRKREARL